ncbi:MAG: filamentous hemagglutinin N-terminal domain-containing protein [Rhodocyclales bacterium]|nr:filamentous hemagglutinin N-terminal domain-containing protein [Rhodocyclales bacterium]
MATLGAWCIASPTLSNPTNPVVVNGTASFNQAGNVLTVTNSNGAIINWDKFGIKAGETTHFAQTAASSTVLNRVLNDPTAIYGTLSSNGKVWLVNPAGIMVGPGGRIDTAGFVASTLNISNENFLAGRKLFENTPGAGNVINQGEIRTPAGGSVYLIGSNVANESLISTPQGETILAAGATVSLVDSATPGVKVDITGAAGNATNLGQITAEAGRIGIAGVIVRNSGLANASSVVNEGGRIFLRASQDVSVDGNGRINATGNPGGHIEIIGNQVTVTDNASIDAGGSLLVEMKGQQPLGPPIFAAPINPGVIGGNSVINQTGGSLSLANGNGAIINWNNFSVPAGGSITFQQPSISSAALNRGLSDRWTLYGTLNSNDKFWLVNPAGIMISPGGRVDTAGFVASTQRVISADFHAARLQAITDFTFARIFPQTGVSTHVGGGIQIVDRRGSAPLSGGATLPSAPLSLIDNATPGIKVDIPAVRGATNGLDGIKAAAMRHGIAGVLVRRLGGPGASIGQ